MNFLLILTVVPVLSVLALPTDPTAVKPCCYPNVWSANIVDTIGEYNRDLDSASLAYGNSDFYFDYPNKQMAYIARVDNQTAQTKTTTWSIFKYAQGKRYDIVNNTCTVSDLTATISSPCIPDDATHFGTHTYPADIKVDVWFYIDKVNGGSRRVGVTQDTCLPMTVSYMSGGPDYRLIMDLYQNVTTTIPKPGVFVVPASCTKHHETSVWNIHDGNVVEMEQDIY